MPPPQRSSFRAVERLSLAATLLTYALLVLGNAVRSTGSGLSYTSWPLYYGRVIPDREFHVLMEFLHRAVAGAVSLLLLALAVVVLRRAGTRARLGLPMLLALALLSVQIVLGALTVSRLLAPPVVTSHLATAQLLFVTLLVTHLLARAEVRGRDVPLSPQPAGLQAMVALCCVATWGQMILGGLVSTSHAGLACPDFPTCHGRWFPPLHGLEGLQMMHRYGAYTLAALLGTTAWRASGSPQSAVRAGALWAAALVVVQIVFGAFNVLWKIPVWLTALHLATATAILGICVATLVRMRLAHSVRESRELLGVVR